MKYAIEAPCSDAQRADTVMLNESRRLLLLTTILALLMRRSTLGSLIESTRIYLVDEYEILSVTFADTHVVKQTSERLIVDRPHRLMQYDGLFVLCFDVADETRVDVGRVE